MKSPAPSATTGEHGELLRPDAAYRHLNPPDPGAPWLLLVKILKPGEELDRPAEDTGQAWIASPAQKFERLLRETRVPVGLLCNGAQLRLIHAPRGENAGSLTFPVKFMASLPGRVVCAALHLLLSHKRLISVKEAARLPALLDASRKYQGNVSTQLAEQVLGALHELLRGFQAADHQRPDQRLLAGVVARNPDEIYQGLLAVLLRLVFLLFAEDRGLMPTGALYQRNYSVHGLFERLRAARERFPDTMDDRYVAWPQLLTLFRVVHSGCKHPEMSTPGRAGNLFDFDRFPFLEGRAARTEALDPARLPLVGDGTVYRVLERLLLLDGERLSYRTLDVEEIGSVYQTIMGFRVERSEGTAIGIKGKRKKGAVPAAPIINLDELLGQSPGKRAAWLKDHAELELKGEAGKALKVATSADDLLAALEKRIDRQATPSPVPEGGLVLQPTDERRRSGSHYTPRSFTRPIVQKTLEPVLDRLGRHPQPEEILALKVCDIAVGSAAFLVETCRQLADELIASWHFHRKVPAIPSDEDEVLHAMRQVAQRCLYGVDRNPMAVDLSKLSLWLATLARDHPFTFLDHAIRCGDSLVGLTRRQIECFTWREEFTTGQLWEKTVRERVANALRERQALLGLGDDYGTPELKRERLAKADEQLDTVRFIGDAAIAAFFSEAKDKAREAKRQDFADRLSQKDYAKWPMQEVKDLRSGEFPVTPFHWEIEFPEVFDRDNPGFNAIVGNPPFVGGGKISGSLGEHYLPWIKSAFPLSHGNSDLVAYFFRRAFNLITKGGTQGLIATNTISQGDTRATGLQWIRLNRGTIYAALRRYQWPGQAVVVVSIVWIAREATPRPYLLNQQTVDKITAYLVQLGPDTSPLKLKENENLNSNGVKIYGSGFTFDDHDTTGLATSISEMNRLLSDPANRSRIHPYIGGAEVNESATHENQRYVINFEEFPLKRVSPPNDWNSLSLKDQNKLERSGEVPLNYRMPVASDWPELLSIVEKNVYPERSRLANGPCRQRWWQFERPRTKFLNSISHLERVLVCSRHQPNWTITFINPQFLCSDALVLNQA